MKAHASLLEEHACREKFGAFFEKMKAKKVEDRDLSWYSAVSPYEVK